MQLEYYQHTLIGKRKVNADALGTSELSSGLFAFLVVDGSPDNLDSELLAQQYCTNLLLNLEKINISLLEQQNAEELERLFITVNNQVFENDAFKNSRLTFALCLLHQKFSVFVHIGNCRIYRINECITFQTQDHTIQQRICKSVDSGDDILTRSIAWKKEKTPEILFQPPIKPSEVIVLCTDGFWRAIDNLVLIELQSKANLPLTIENLKKQLSLLHLKDNLSFQLIKGPILPKTG